MARAVAKRSLCVRDQVGAVVVDTLNKVIGEGYNGPPRGFWHGQVPCDKWCERGKLPSDVEVRKLSRDYEDCVSLHAEANCLMVSDRTLRAGGAIYVTSHVCYSCAKLIANSGLHRVYVETQRADAHRASAQSYNFLTQCKLSVTVNGEEWKTSE